MNTNNYIKNLSINDAVNLGKHLKYLFSFLDIVKPSKDMIYYLIEGYEAYNIERVTDPNLYVHKQLKDFRNKFL